jgi:hypothetical protein
MLLHSRHPWRSDAGAEPTGMYLRRVTLIITELIPESRQGAVNQVKLLILHDLPKFPPF